MNRGDQLATAFEKRVKQARKVTYANGPPKEAALDTEGIITFLADWQDAAMEFIMKQGLVKKFDRFFDEYMDRKFEKIEASIARDN